MDARISDHSAWAARGHWRKAYDEAQAEIARLQAEVERLAALNEELDGANIVNRNAIRMLKVKLSAARNDALEDAAMVANDHDRHDIEEAIRALKTGDK